MARPRKIPAPAPPGKLDVPQTCKFLGISKPTLYRYMKDTDFPAPSKDHGRTWFVKAELEAWREARMKPQEP